MDITCVDYVKKLPCQTNTCTLSWRIVHANHASISIQGPSPISFRSQVHFEHCIPNVVACNVLGWALHTIGYGMALNTTHNTYVAPWREWCIEDGTCGDMCLKPTPFWPTWVEANWVGGAIICEGWGVGQKSPLGPCVGWVDLYSHFNYGWLGQSMLLFSLPHLGRSLGNNSLTLG